MVTDASPKILPDSLNVNLAQTKCVVGADDRQCVRAEGQLLPSADSGLFNENMVERCFAMSQCQIGDNWNMLPTSLPTTCQSHNAPSASIRMQQQPFVSDGDIFVYAQSELCFHAFRSFHSRAPSHSLHT